jgi:hypothetical protein
VTFQYNLVNLHLTGKALRHGTLQTHGGRGSTKIDTPLILATVPNAMLEPEQTLQRTFEKDFLPVVEGPIWLLLYASSSNFRVIFILALSSRVPGAYERLGILDVPHYTYKNPEDWSAIATNGSHRQSELL